MNRHARAGNPAETLDALTPLSPDAPGDPEPFTREYTVTIRVSLPYATDATEARQVTEAALMRDAAYTRIGYPGYRATVIEITEA